MQKAISNPILRKTTQSSELRSPLGMLMRGQALRTMVRTDSGAPRRVLGASKIMITEDQQYLRGATVFAHHHQVTSSKARGYEMPVDRRGEFMFSNPEVCTSAASRYEMGDDDLLHL